MRLRRVFNDLRACRCSLAGTAVRKRTVAAAQLQNGQPASNLSGGPRPQAYDGLNEETAFMRKMIVVVAVSVCAFPLIGQNLTLGSLSGYGATTIGATLPNTFIDVSHPATIAGSVAAATVQWRSGTSSNCSSSMKIRVVRAQSNGTLTIVGERGPFATHDGIVSVTLTRRSTFLRATCWQSRNCSRSAPAVVSCSSPATQPTAWRRWRETS
jgi:hypothetical protein